MTLEELQAKLEEINHLVVTFQTSVALEKYYAENIVMIEGDGTITTGKEACRQGRAVFFNEMLVEFRESSTTVVDFEVDVPDDACSDVTVQRFDAAVATSTNAVETTSISSVPNPDTTTIGELPQLTRQLQTTLALEGAERIQVAAPFFKFDLLSSNNREKGMS
jgi:hypothetical protein